MQNSSLYFLFVYLGSGCGVVDNAVAYHTALFVFDSRLEQSNVVLYGTRTSQGDNEPEGGILA